MHLKSYRIIFNSNGVMENTRTTITLPAELYERVAESAKRNCRTFSSEIRFRLGQAVEPGTELNDLCAPSDDNQLKESDDS